MSKELVICSDGQDGVCLAVLKIAKRYAVKTAGFMALGYMTASGEKNSYDHEYGLKQWASTGGFKAAIKANCLMSEATVIIWSKPEATAAEAIIEYNKPFLGLRLEKEDDEEFRKHGRAIADFVTRSGTKKLNVTGNPESVSPSSFKSTCWIMRYAFEELGYKLQDSK